MSYVPIPDAPIKIKEKINELIIKSYNLRDESNKMIDEATRLLVEELRLPDLSAFCQDKKESVSTFSVKLSDFHLRADASYHIPEVDKIINYMSKNAAEITTIGDKRISKRIVLAGVFKRTYVDKKYGYPFLGGREITQLNPETEKYLSKSIHKARYEKELRVAENTILVTDRGTVGTVALVPKHWDGYAVSQNVLKLIPSSDEISGYVYIFLNSVYGKMLIQRQTYGSVVDMIDNNSLASVQIPILKNIKIQKKINELALGANKKRYDAYLCEEEALKVLNDEILFSKV